MLITTPSLDYQGTVSGIYDELEIRKVIGEVLSKLGQHKLAHTIVVKTMLLNCPGFSNCPGFTKSHLYMYFQYLESLPIERLSGL